MPKKHKLTIEDYHKNLFYKRLGRELRKHILAQYGSIEKFALINRLARSTINLYVTADRYPSFYKLCELCVYLELDPRRLINDELLKIVMTNEELYKV